MLGRRRKDGSPVIKVDQLRDGVVLFEDVPDAEQYTSYLEADRHEQVRLTLDPKWGKQICEDVVLKHAGAHVPMLRQSQFAVSCQARSGQTCKGNPTPSPCVACRFQLPNAMLMTFSDMYKRFKDWLSFCGEAPIYLSQIS